VAVHPDHRAQTLLEQIRERESVQAIDRLRLVHLSAGACDHPIEPCAGHHRRSVGHLERNNSVAN
jgi:hypothetical protein